MLAFFEYYFNGKRNISQHWHLIFYRSNICMLFLGEGMRAGGGLVFCFSRGWEI